MAWRRFLCAAGVVACFLGVPEAAGATSIDFSKGTVSISGLGSILASYGFPGFTVSSAGTYAFAVTTDNLTGTSASPASGESFFDVFVELEIDGTTHPCGSAPTLLPGGALGCQVNLSLAAGAHSIFTFLSLTFANPVHLTDSSLFLIDTLGANGPPVPVVPRGGGMSAGAKIAIVGAVAGGGAAAGIMASGTRRANGARPVVPEPGTASLVAIGCGVLAIGLRRSRRRRRSE